MYPEHLQKFIPPEFDLSKYEQTVNMELIHWVDNLMKREKAYRSFLNGDYEFTEYKYSPHNEEFHDFINHGLSDYELFERDVLANNLNGSLLDESVHNLVQAMFVDETSQSASIISEMNFEDLILLEKENITQEKRDEYSTVEYSMFPSVRESNLGELSKPIHSYNSNNEIEFSWLKVDMSCSDSEISTAFKDWLKLHRSKEKSFTSTKRREHKLKKINRTSLLKWHDAKVLAYIDIVTWNFLTKQKVTSINLGEILFPDPKITSDRAKMIDDTTKPYAEKLTSSRFMRRMIKIVVDEKRKKTS